MLHNYFKIALRQLRKHKLFSALNIFGLATAMSVCLLVIMILLDQYGYDEFHENKDRIHRVISAKSEHQVPTEPGLATTSLQLADELNANYPFVEKTARIVGMGADFKVNGEKIEFEGTGYAVDQSFFDVFTFEWMEGEQGNALAEPRTIVLTKELADKFFPKTNPIGRTVEFGDLGEFKVTGLMADPPIRSHIYFEYLISYATITAMTEEERGANSIYGYDNIWRGLVYVLLNNKSDLNQLDQALTELAAEYSERDQNNYYLFESQALSDVMPSRDLGNEIGIGTPAMVMHFLTALGIIIILAACFNYMNLSVARSLKRSKEIGIRKVIGARKRDVIFQFLGEAVLIAVFSFLVAIGLLEFLIPAFYNLDPFVGEIFNLPRTPGVYLMFFVFSLLVGLFAGFFPAVNIAKFQPIQAIQQLANVKLFSRVGVRKALVTVQFILSLIFILTVIIVLQQQKHILDADIGVNTDNLFNVWMNEQVDYEVFAQKVKQLKGVEDVSASRYAILLGGGNVATVNFLERQDSMELYFNRVSKNYIKNMEIELVAGTDFPDNSLPENDQFIILNKKATESMGFESPAAAIGETIKMDTQALTVIGVTDDFRHDNIWFSDIQPFGFMEGKNIARSANIRLNGVELSTTVNSIHQIWDELSPNKSINGYFTDTRVYYMSKFFRMGSMIIGFVGILTIIISCMGLLGMVVYTIEGKLKEVGVRKVLGASTANLNWHLSKGFFLLLGIAIFIAVPLVLFVGNMWLQNFSLRIAIAPWMILAGVGIILMLAVVTVFTQTNSAARTNPVHILRDE
ncbi:MAG: ABC transporter permease [Bacteroidota bacterium]